MSTQLPTSACTVRIPAELRDRLDAARGAVPREAFVRALLAGALADSHLVFSAGGKTEVPTPIPGQTSIDDLPPVLVEGPGGQAVVDEQAAAEQHGVRTPSSAQARAAVKPIPKGGKA